MTDLKTDQEVGAEIRRRMSERHISDKAMAGMVAMARTTLVRKLDGGSAFTMQEFLRICGVLNCSPDDILLAS